MGGQLDELLRECALSYGHIQLFRDKHGWQASICHYPPSPSEPARQVDSKICGDPVEALRKALLEDARLTRDFARRYAAAPKQIDIEEAIAATQPHSIDFEDILG